MAANGTLAFRETPAPPAREPPPAPICLMLLELRRDSQVTSSGANEVQSIERTRIRPSRCSESVR